MALSLALATGVAAHAQTAIDARGTVVRLDAPANVVMLDDGRLYQITPNTVVMVNNQPVPIAALQPGAVVMIRSAEIVTLRNGQYVAVGPAVPPPAPAPPPAVVVTPPAPAGNQPRRSGTC